MCQDWENGLKLWLCYITKDIDAGWPGSHFWNSHTLQHSDGKQSPHRGMACPLRWHSCTPHPANMLEALSKWLCFVTSQLFDGFGRYPKPGPSIASLFHHTRNCSTIPMAAESSAYQICLHTAYSLPMSEMVARPYIGIARESPCVVPSWDRLTIFVRILQTRAYIVIYCATIHDNKTHVPYDCILHNKQWLYCQWCIVLHV